VRADGHGVSLEVRGARAGRVLVALGRAAGQRVRVEGLGANVRIWAHVHEDRWETIAKAVARAAGLAVEVDREAGFFFLDPLRAARERRRKFLQSVDLTPVETRLLASGHAREAADVLSQTVLSCRGRLVAAPARGILMASDHAGNLNELEALLKDLDRTTPLEPAPARPAVSAPRIDSAVRSGWTLEPAPARPAEVVRCEHIEAIVPRNLAPGQSDADGVAAGDFVVELARTRGKQAIIGCGGDRAVFVHTDVHASIEDAANAAGLAPIDETTFASRDMLARSSLAQRQTASPNPPRELRLFDLPHADEAAVAIASMLAKGDVSVAYAPTSRVVVYARGASMDRVEDFAKAWRQTRTR
jgi:hypothetical protein